MVAKSSNLIISDQEGANFILLRTIFKYARYAATMRTMFPHLHLGDEMIFRAISLIVALCLAGTTAAMFIQRDKNRSSREYVTLNHGWDSTMLGLVRPKVRLQTTEAENIASERLNVIEEMIDKKIAALEAKIARADESANKNALDADKNEDRPMTAAEMKDLLAQLESLKRDIAIRVQVPSMIKTQEQSFLQAHGYNILNLSAAFASAFFGWLAVRRRDV